MRALGLAVAAATLVVVPASGKGFRLDDFVEPRFQSLTLTVDADVADYSGHTAIDVTVHESTTSFLMNAKEIEISSIVLGSRALDYEQLDNGIIRVGDGDPIEPGDHRLEFTFTNELNTQSVALYKVEYEGRAYTFTQFEATEARLAFPCWDEPAYKIPWQTTLRVPEAHAAYANTPVESERRVDGMREIQFEPTPPMPSYLVAVATGPLEEVPVSGLRVPGNIVVPAGKSGLVAEAVAVTPVIFDALEKYFGTPYPYEKLDQVAVPEFWYGAMENAGLIVYRESLLVRDPAKSTPAARRRQIEVIAHEIAHQWFGNLVTMQWWDDLWLNEAFATWMATKISHDLYPELDFDVLSVRGGNRAMLADARVATRSVRQPVENEANLLQSADVLAYQKGEKVLHMFEQWMGPDVFRQGVVDYLQANKWGNATADDLWTALGAAAGVDVKTAMGTFLEQPGVPFVQVRDLGDGRVRIDQSRFHNLGAELEESGLWHIPMVLRYADDAAVHTKDLLIDQPSQVVDLEIAGELRWLHPSAGESGYYRWSLDPEHLTRLCSAAGDVLTVPEQVGLAGHVSALLDAGVIYGDDYLRFIEALGHEAAPQTLDSVMGMLGNVRDAFITSELEDAYAGYVNRFLAPHLDTFGFEVQTGEPESVTDVRPDLLGMLARGGRNQRVIDRFLEWADAYLDDPASVPPSMASRSLAMAARHGDQELFETFRNRFETATTPRDRRQYLTSLGAFGTAELRDAALDYALDGPLRPQEVMSIPMAMGSGLPGESRDMTGEVLWTWFTDNHEAISARMPPAFQLYHVYFASGCNLDRVERAREFFFGDESRVIPGRDVEFAKMEEGVRECVTLRERNLDRVAAYLEGSLAERGSTR